MKMLRILTLLVAVLLPLCLARPALAAQTMWLFEATGEPEAERSQAIDSLKSAFASQGVDLLVDLRDTPSHHPLRTEARTALLAEAGERQSSTALALHIGLKGERQYVLLRAYSPSAALPLREEHVVTDAVADRQEALADLVNWLVAYRPIDQFKFVERHYPGLARFENYPRVYEQQTWVGNDVAQRHNEEEARLCLEQARQALSLGNSQEARRLAKAAPAGTTLHQELADFLVSLPIPAAQPEAPGNLVATLPQTQAPLVKPVQRLPRVKGSSYTVSENESLWLISKRVWGQGNLWPLIYRYNRQILESPSHLPVGTKLVIPARTP